MNRFDTFSIIMLGLGIFFQSKTICSLRNRISQLEYEYYRDKVEIRSNEQT